MKAKEAFQKLEVLIDQACDDCSFGIAIRGAEALGMIGGKGNNQWSLDYDFELVDDSGEKVALSFHSYDQSKAFSVRPDMNKFELTLTATTGVATVHRNQYER
ncbi:hypothetical protein LMG28614_06720 [Paraburkholderia ultramafica]|uniref:Uncharacterized protein n=1 Tax=Paraburkholderia ultramafica TaxID=1544867 RepID=A0A6S7BPG7_9BURK|nr:hypothetical protein [Paraburkholderia ultramafica]CAB3808014.1 hypothetical protein LMG28614_06720 [Paraburkholderia ultramafica]